MQSRHLLMLIAVVACLCATACGPKAPAILVVTKDYVFFKDWGDLKEFHAQSLDMARRHLASADKTAFESDIDELKKRFTDAGHTVSFPIGGRLEIIEYLSADRVQVSPKVTDHGTFTPSGGLLFVRVRSGSKEAYTIFMDGI